MHAINYFAPYGDFYVSGTQNAEVTKSLTGSVERIYRLILGFKCYHDHPKSV